MYGDEFCDGLGLLGLDDIVLVDINRNLMRKRAAVSDALLKSRRWQAVVMCEDNVELDTGIWIDTAKRYGIRSIIVPYTISNTVEFAESYVGHAPYQVQATRKTVWSGGCFRSGCWTTRAGGSCAPATQRS